VDQFFRIVGLPFYLLWTGIKPGKHDPKAWYDRTIRILGGALLGALFIWATISEVMRHF
jgi:hypothetical protein